MASALVNLPGMVDAGTIEALEGGMASKDSRDCDCEFSPARASLKRLFAGVALTVTAGERVGFLSSVTL